MFINKYMMQSKNVGYAAAVFIFVVSVFASVLLPDEASAAYVCEYNGVKYANISKPYDNRAPQNFSECKARMLCYSDPSYRRGAIWFSNQSDYYSDDVIVPSGATTVSVSIRGSYFSCGKPAASYPVMAAHTIRDYTSYIRLNRTSGIVTDVDEYLNRGNTSGSYKFSSQGNYKPANLYVGGLSWNGRGCLSGHSCANLQIDLYRCPYNVYSPSTDCYDDPVYVTVNKPIEWVLNPSTTISSNTVYPTETLTWYHKITNGGPNSTNRIASYDYINGQDLGTANSANTPIDAGLAKDKSITFNTNILIDQDDVGKTYCRATRVSPHTYVAGTTDGTYTSGYQCATMPYNYTLTPNVNVDNSDAIDIGAVYRVTAEVTNGSPNSKPGTKSKPTDWQLTELQFKSTVTVPTTMSTSTSATTPCSVFVGELKCTTLKTGIGAVFDANSPNQSIGSASTDVTMNSDLDAGDQVCYVLSVRPYISNAGSINTDWRHSIIKCLKIAKKPKVNVWGGDVKVGRSFFGKDFNSTAEIRTSTTVKTPTTFGSWAEYALVAPGIITGAGSGSALNGGLNNVANVCQYSALSFSNADTNKSCSSSITAKNDSIGNYSFNKTSIPDISSKFPLIKGTTPVLPASGSLDSKNGLYTVDDTNAVTITGSTISKGKWVVVNAPNATVTITGDIKLYAGADIEQISEIPQVIIIAKNIRIASGVKQIDSWLIAKSDSNDVGGAINTCVMANGAPVTPDICKEKLVINGPVMSKTLRLERTAGSDSATGSGSPAEVINLRADAYLWAYYHAAGSGRVWTAYSTNVPPRL